MVSLHERNDVDRRLNDAIQCFRNGHFEDALKIYNALKQVIAAIPTLKLKEIREEEYGLSGTPVVGPIVHPKLGTVLDQRAATYEKLGKLDRALKDGEDVIKSDPLSCKGYLRTSKILIKMKRHLEAYKILQQGLYTIKRAVEKFNIEVPSKLFESMKNQHSLMNAKLKLERENKTGPKDELRISENSNRVKRCVSETHLVPQKKVKLLLDPVNYLPFEILQRIFCLLPFHELLKCHFVSKLWYHRLTSIPELYCFRLQTKVRLTSTELSNGLQLLRRILKRSNRKRVNMFKMRTISNEAQFNRALEILASEKDMAFAGLDICNMHLSFESFIGKFYKCNFANLKMLSELRLGIKSSLNYENILFHISKNLRALEVMVIGDTPSRSLKSLLPLNSKFKNYLEHDDTPYENLEKLTLVNNPSLLKDKNEEFPSIDTYNPWPPFLEKNFPNLTTLTIVSYDFTRRQGLFQDFLSRSRNLKLLYLEDNEQITVSGFLQDLVTSNAEFRLTRLTLRERKLTRETSLNNLNEESVLQLRSLRYLDAYGSSLSIRGFLKLLRLSNLDNNLQTLLIGNSNYLYFKDDKISANRHRKLSISDILSVAPALERLHINELDLDNSTMKFFHNELVEFGLENLKLKILDLSFCNKIDGIGLMNLFNFRVTKNNDSSPFSIEELFLDGIDFNEATLNYLMRKGFVKKISNDVHRVRWKKYGVNTLVMNI